MSRAIENLQTVNSFIRTLLALVVVGGAGTAGWYGYNVYTAGERAEEDLASARQELEARVIELEASRKQVAEQAEEIDSLHEDVQAKQAVIEEQEDTITEQATEIDRLDLALRMHKMQRRLARIVVLEVEKDAESGETYSQIEFTELNDLGDPIGEPKQFRLKGDLIYIDCLVVKFDDKYVEQADLERGTSICMFNRIFGEFQQPGDGFPLDEPGQQPGAYDRGGMMSELEKKIWADFWTIANEPQRAAELGIRTAHGDAVSIKVIKGKTYRIVARASGDPEIEVVENGQPRISPGAYF